MTKPFQTEILHEDDAIVVINKPPGLLTLPDRFAADKPNLMGELTRRFGKIFTMHRLDRETSGILVFAKTEAAHRQLSIDFEKRAVDKIYLALLDGVLHVEEGEIDKPIGESPVHPGKMIISNLGKPSMTLFRVRERFKNYTLVEAKILTGRQHQIRVHFLSNGYPLAVDAIYGRRSELFLSEIKLKKLKQTKDEEPLPLMNRTTLHAFRLALNHPTTGERLEFEAPLHKDFQAVLSQLRKWNI